MLTVLHPEILTRIRSFPGGLLPVRLPEEDQLSLVVKASKEMILAAKLRQGFNFYVPALPTQDGTTTSLITAFFDDSYQPLTITSPLFGGDPWCDDVLKILSYDHVDIYFFDEQNYEWLSYRATLDDQGSCLIGSEPIYLLAYHPLTAQSLQSALMNWFGQSGKAEDEQSIQVVFEEALSPEDLFITDLTVEGNAYLGSGGFRHDSLTRDDPGYFQERDISSCLMRSFEPQKIMMGPRRKDTYKEILDHLVLTDDVAVLVQAKDSPTTEVSLNRPLERKRLATHNQISDAIKQINGAARFLKRQTIAKLVVGGEDFEVALGDRKVIGLVIVKELFEDEGPAYADACRNLSNLSGGGMIMDYSSFHAFTHHFASENGFLAALAMLARDVGATGRWIKPKEFVVESVLATLAELRAKDDEQQA